MIAPDRSISVADDSDMSAHSHKGEGDEGRECGRSESDDSRRRSIMGLFLRNTRVGEQREDCTESVESMGEPLGTAIQSVAWVELEASDKTDVIEHMSWKVKGLPLLLHESFGSERFGLCVRAVERRRVQGFRRWRVEVLKSPFSRLSSTSEPSFERCVAVAMSGSLSTASVFVCAARAGAKIASTSLLASSSSTSKRGRQGDVFWRRGSQLCSTAAALSRIFFPFRVKNGTSTGGVGSSMLQLAESTDALLAGLGLSVPDDKIFAGVLSRRDLGVLFSNSFVASADVHLHQRHNGIHVFEKPHPRQTNKGRFG